jgi:adhesin transport system outer membrane protein
MTLSLYSNIFAMTLEEASVAVFNEHPEIKERAEHYRDTKHDYEIAKAGFLPKIDISATAGREKYKATPDGSVANPDNILSTKTYGAALNQNIFNGFADYHEVKAQKNRVLSAEIYLKEKSDDILLSLVENYLATMKKYEQIQIAKENVEEHKKTYEKIKERRDVGYSTISELWQAEGRYVLAQSNLVAADLNYQDTKATLAKILSKQINGQDLKKPEFDLTIPNTVEDAISIAYENNPSILAERYNTEALKQEYRGSYSSFLPKIDFSLSASRSDNASGLKQTIDDVSGLFKVSYSLFNGFADYEKTKKYIVSVNSQVATTEKVKREVTEKLQLAWNSYLLITRQIEFLTRHVELAQKTSEAYQEEFLLGRRTIIDLLGAESELNDAKKELVGAQYDLLFAKYRVYDAMYGLTDALVKRNDAMDKEVKSVVFKRQSPDAADSEKRIQKELQRNKKQSESNASIPIAMPASTPPAQISTEPINSTPSNVGTDSNSTTDKSPGSIAPNSIEGANKNQVAPEGSIQKALEKNKNISETNTTEVPARQDTMINEPKVVKPAVPVPETAPPVFNEPIDKVQPTPSESKIDTPISAMKDVVDENKAPVSVSNCYRVAAKRLFIRVSASATSRKIGYRSKNRIVCSDESVDGWIKLSRGWMSTEYLVEIKK